MTAQIALKAALRDILGPAARHQGYRGSPPNWRKSSPTGDWAVVNIQSSSSSDAGHVQCTVNLAFAPEPWLRWQAECLGPAMPKSISESLGLYRERLQPRGTPDAMHDWWDVFDEASAAVVVEDMKSQLDRAGWPVLQGMFSREAMMARLRDGDLGFMKRAYFGVLFARAEALLLMDAGPSAALESRLDYALNSVLPIQREHADRFDAWVRAEAAKA